MDILSMFLLMVFIVVTAERLIEKYRNSRRIACIIDHFGGDKWYPIVGTEWPLLKAGRKNFWKEYLRRNARHGPVFRSWSGSVPVLHLRKANHIELSMQTLQCSVLLKSCTRIHYWAVLNSAENVDKGATYKFMLPWFGNGLLTSKKTKWRIHRKLLTPSFHFSILEHFSEIFSVKSQMLADQILPLSNGEYFDIFPYLLHCTLDIICETAMGVKVNAMQKSDSEYVKAVQGILEKIMERIFNPFYHNNFIYNMTKKGRTHGRYLHILHKYTEKVILDRKLQLTQTKIQDRCNDECYFGAKQKQTFLDLLLRINDTNKDFHLTLEDIRDEVNTFMFGGNDSSAVTSCWTLFLIGNHPDVQEKLHQELDSIFHGDENPVTSQDLSEMKYLECVIKESLRIFTAVPAISRELSTEIDIDGHKIPPGVTAVLHFYELHKDPELYPDPNTFNPERFLPENSRQRHPFAFIPFSAGPRNCIGQKYALRSAKTLLSTLLRRYKVKALKKPHEVDCYFDIFLRPQDGMFLSFEVRNPKELFTTNYA